MRAHWLTDDYYPALAWGGATVFGQDIGIFKRPPSSRSASGPGNLIVVARKDNELYA